MKLEKKVLGLLAALLLVLTISAAVGAEEKAPLTIDADWISYDSETGDFAAKGNVQAKQQGMFLQADSLEGNMDTKDIYASGNVFWQKEQDKLKGQELMYNYQNQVGFLAKGEGCFEGYRIKAERLERHSHDKVTLNEGAITGCNAQLVKCYEITAKKIVIHPGEKLVAHDASFWIRGKKVFTLKKYTKKLTKKEKDSGIPQLGYSNSKGVSVRYKHYLSVEENQTKLLNIDYYGKFGLLPKYQEDREATQGKWSLVIGKELDKDSKPMEMLPSLFWEQKKQKLANTSWSYNLGAGGGYFKQNGNSTWRTSGSVNLNNDPIQLSDKAHLNLWAGYQQNWYGNRDKLGFFSYGVGVNQLLGTRGTLGLTYIHRDISGKTPFNFDDPGKENELVANLDYQLDQYWKIGVSANYDLDANRYTDLDYTVTRKLHCFEAKVTWREKRDELNWSIDLAEF